MRTSLPVALILVIFSGHALAAPKGKKGTPKHPVETMDSNDPAAKELSEKKEEEAKPDTVEIQKKEEARVDAVQVAKTRARDKAVAFGNVLIGFGKAPESGPGPDVSTGKTTAVTFMAGAHYDLSPAFTFGARVPWTVGSATQVDGLKATTAALGALELMGEYRVGLSLFTRLPITLGLGVPIAQGTYNTTNGFRQTQMNEFADAASGYRDGELFGPKRLPIVVGFGIEYARRALSLHAANKLVFGVKVGGKIGSPDALNGSGSNELKAVSFRDVLSGGIAYRFLDKPNLFGALDSWIAYNGVYANEFNSKNDASGPTRFQFVFEPRVGARFDKISPSLGYIFPIGGRLADNSTSGLELHCDVAF